MADSQADDMRPVLALAVALGFGMALALRPAPDQPPTTEEQLS